MNIDLNIEWCPGKCGHAIWFSKWESACFRISMFYDDEARPHLKPITRCPTCNRLLVLSDFLGHPYEFRVWRQTTSVHLLSARSTVHAESKTNIPKLESPIEEMFWDAWQAITTDIHLVAQYEAANGAYRLDFAIPEKKIAIECDGYAWHCSKDQFTNDRRRQRQLERMGWRVIRFSGQEIYQNASKCAAEAKMFIQEVWA